jgi:PatG C-terminal
MEATPENDPTADGSDAPAPRPTPPSAALSPVAPQQAMTSACPTCAPPGASFVYALGRIEPRFPSIAVEKEFAQVVARGDSKGKTDREMMHAVLTRRENRYLARQLCWVLTIQGLETYLLTPRDPVDVELLVEAIRPRPHPTDLDVVIGNHGPMAPPEMCNGLMVPIVVFDQVYSFDRDSLIKAIPRPPKVGAREFQAAAEELFDRILQLTDNAGATDENRALNYLSVRYPAIYAKTAEQFAAGASLSAVEVRPSPLSGVRHVVDVVFSYTQRATDVTEKFFTRVDVSEEFPFLVTKLSPYFDR